MTMMDSIIPACDAVSDIVETIALNRLNVLKKLSSIRPQLLSGHLPGPVTTVPSDRVHNQHGGRSGGARQSLRPERRLLAQAEEIGVQYVLRILWRVEEGKS